MEVAEWKRTRGQDANAEDVLVRVFPPSHTSHEESDPLLSLPLHSHVLCARSSFFSARLSQLWQPAQPPLTNTSANNSDSEDSSLFTVDITAVTSSDADTYKRCIGLMYVQREDMISYHSFSGVDDTLCMLRIAVELLFQDCMDACMEFLDMLCSWTPVEEESIRSTISSLQLVHIHQDLARRLWLPQIVASNEPTLIFRRMLAHVLQVCSHRMEPALDLDPSEPIPESSIVQAWKIDWVLLSKAVLGISKGICVDDAKAVVSRLLLFFDRLLALRVADAVVRAFAQDEDVSDTITRFFDRNNGPGTSGLAEMIGDLLVCMMRSVVEGQVLLPQATRWVLIKTWLPVGNTKVVCSKKPQIASMMMTIIRSLPIVDREQLYRESMVADSKGPKNLMNAFLQWCDMLREVHTQLGGGCMIVVGKE